MNQMLTSLARYKAEREAAFKEKEAKQVGSKEGIQAKIEEDSRCQLHPHHPHPHYPRHVHHCHPRHLHPYPQCEDRRDGAQRGGEQGGGAEEPDRHGLRHTAQGQSALVSG